MDFSAVDTAVTAAIEKGVFPGAVVLVNSGGSVVYRQAWGWRSLEPTRTPLNAEVIFDLASLTKPLATTVACMLLVKERQLCLDDRISRFLPHFGVGGKSSITVRHLLSHTSGLPAVRSYYRDLATCQAKAGKAPVLGTRRAKEWVYAQLQGEKLDAPVGQQTVYSDLGFMVLGAVIEKISGVEFDRYCHENIFHPLELPSTGFFNLELTHRHGFHAQLEKFAPTERCPWRQRVLCGEVHDDNAYAMGGVAGHAGLFSTVDDLERLVSCLVSCYRDEHPFLPSTVVREFWTRDGRVPGSTWALGWDTPSPQHSSAGEFFSSHAVGHLGFTGTSLWIDLARHIYVIVLSNRVHPRRDNDKIHTFRPALHNAVMRVVLEEGS